MVRLKVSGMTCDHCVQAVSRAVRSVPSVEEVTVDLEHGEVMVRGDPDEDAIWEAIADEGYSVSTAA
jgi:copper chaperone